MQKYMYLNAMTILTISEQKFPLNISWNFMQIYIENFPLYK